MRPVLKIRYLLDFTARKFRNVVFKIQKVAIFKTNSFIAQYFKDISIIISILFTGKMDGPKLAKFHFCQQIQYPFSIHNSDRVAESLSKSSIFPTCSFFIELLKVYFNPDGTGKNFLKISKLAVRLVKKFAVNRGGKFPISRHLFVTSLGYTVGLWNTHTLLNLGTWICLLCYNHPWAPTGVFGSLAFFWQIVSSFIVHLLSFLWSLSWHSKLYIWKGPLWMD